MPIRLICACGNNLALPDKYAGEHVQCPQCRVMLRIPTREEDADLARWLCSCGQRLKARARSAGRKLPCPRCGAITTVPLVDKKRAFVEEKLKVSKRKPAITQPTIPEPPARLHAPSQSAPASPPLPLLEEEELELEPVRKEEAIEVTPDMIVDMEGAEEMEDAAQTYSVEAPRPDPVPPGPITPPEKVGTPPNRARKPAKPAPRAERQSE